MLLLGVRGAPATAPGRLNQNLFDKLQFRADPQSRRLKRNAVTCAFVPREGGSTRKVLSKLQLIEKFLVGRAEPGPTRSTKLQQIAIFCGARPVWPTHLRGWMGGGAVPIHLLVSVDMRAFVTRDSAVYVHG